MKVVSDFRLGGGFHHVLQSQISRNIAEKRDKKFQAP